MEPVTLLLGAALFIIAIIAVLFLLPVDKRKAEIARQVNKLHGPTNYPIFGSTLPFLFIKRNGEYILYQKSIPRRTLIVMSVI
jgi:hypothetical protein